MKNILLFSNNIKKLRFYFQFQIVKYWKIFVLAFKWNKNIELEQLSYFREWRFEKSYLVIHFKFKNAVWYRLKSIKRINCLEPIILNVENIDESRVEFIIYGFFCKKIYLIDVKKSESLITETFKTKINNNLQKIPTTLKLSIKKPLLKTLSINLELNEIETNIQPISINLNNYNQKDFI